MPSRARNPLALRDLTNKLERPVTRKKLAVLTESLVTNADLVSCILRKADDVLVAGRVYASV